MNIYDIKTRSYNELSQGYFAQKEYICPLCDSFKCNEAYQLKQHLKEEHNNRSVRTFRYGKSSSSGYVCPLCDFVSDEKQDMDNHFIAEHFDEIENRFYFYRLTGSYICLHCDYICSDEKEMQLHQREVHFPAEEAQFIQLLTADSAFVNVLSYTEKMTLLYAYYGMTNVEISRTLNISANTVGTILFRFLKRATECKVVLRLYEMLRVENSSNPEQEMPQDEIPGLDREGNVIGFYNKDRLHNPADPIAHASVILLIAKKDLESSSKKIEEQLRFLVCTKSSQFLTLAAKTENIDDLLLSEDEKTTESKRVRKRWLDFQGGQCEKQDSPNIEIGKPLPSDIFLAAAEREYKEEIRIKASGLKSSAAKTAIRLKEKSEDMSKFRYLYTDKVYRSPLDPVGLNTEISQVFVYRLPDELAENSVLVRDKWTDSVGGIKEKEYPSQFLLWSEIEQLSASQETVLMEGAKRVVERLKQDSNLKKKMFDLLEEIGD
ncbi:MAG: LuxR C-terminal-related transcriptional regulator [Erysipelotrichaceae bacterium]|jgi:8-oxo-dGTP pyrophosphatase MutT (NUDIX family)